MTENPEPIIMKLHRAGGKQFASRAVAVALAEMIFKETYGEENFKFQQPLQVSETPDKWIIEGSRSYDDQPVPPDQLREGKVLIEIAKFDCRIIKLTKLISFVPQ